MKIKVLFVCETNGMQSPMAEALLDRLNPEHFDVMSAGIDRGEMHPIAVEVMKEIGIDLADRTLRSVHELDGRSFDFVITMTEYAKSRCPRFLNAESVHWKFDYDPGTPDMARRKRALVALRDQIAHRIRLFALVQVRFARPAASATDDPLRSIKISIAPHLVSQAHRS